MTPEQFVLGIIRDCNARALFCGENFTFGARAAGTPELLRQLCAPLGVEVVVLPMAQFEEKPVSSTRIRTALEGGDIPAANAMLGMPYAIRFTVHHGAGLGRTLGVPTINQLYPQGFQLPRYGIYITRTRIGDRWYPSATGLGTRPTVNSDESKVTCETFIPGFTGDLYGTDPVVEFHAYLSPSKSSTRWMSCARASTTQPSARRNTLRSELYEKTTQKWCLRILVRLAAVLVLLGVADSCRVQEDPHRTLVQGSLQELNDSWTLETDQQAVYDIPESMGKARC